MANPPQQHKNRIVSESGRVVSESHVTGSDVSLRLANGGEDAIKTIARIKADVAAMNRGEADPAALRRKLERYYFTRLQARRRGSAPQIKGAKLIKIVYARSPSFLVGDYWDWLPASDGSPAMVAGRCPECYFRAPSTVNPDEQTKPTFVEGRLAWIIGNPEADAKVVTFRLTHPIFHMNLDDKNRLTVREIVKCPSGRHGPNQVLVGTRCDWKVRIEDGVATPIGSSILRSTGTARNAAIITGTK